MRVDVYAVAWNEERMLPHFLRHYERVADRIVIYDNGSDDGTCDIVRAHPKAELRSYDTGGTIHAGIRYALLGSCYREVRGKADWVIVADCDEFLHHPDLRGLLERYLDEGVTFPKVRGYSMVSDDPLPDGRSFRGLLCDHYVWGAPNPAFDKRAVFSPEIDIHWVYGRHACHPEGPVVESSRAELKLLHYKHFAVEEVFARYRALRGRVSGFNRERGLSFHYRESRRKLRASHERYKRAAVDVLRA